jgi:hypothetical protein
MELGGASWPPPNDSLERIGVIVSLIIPSDSLWRLASAQMSPERLATFGIPSPWTSVNPPTYWIAVWAAGLIIGGICLAGWAFSHRDL